MAAERDFMTIDWPAITGLPWFWVDLISVPIFSAIAGLLTNWTGVIMMFAPVKFSGFYCPGVKQIFPFLPRKLQVLPIFAPGSILGFQGFIPARGEKMASLMVDKALAKIGSVRDFVRELDPELIAEHVAKVGHSQLRPIVDGLMEKENPQLWHDLSPHMKEVVYKRIEDEMPRISRVAFQELSENIDQLVDIKLLSVMHIKRNPWLLKKIFYGIGEPELRFMVRSGLLGAPMGLVLALILHAYPLVPFLAWIPAWLFVLLGAACIGIIVNIIAIRVVFTPGNPEPRYKVPWKQALLARRQEQAAADLGHVFAYEVITIPNITRELLEGPRGDRTLMLLTNVLTKEIKGLLGPATAMLRVAVGAKEFDAIGAGSGAAVSTAIAPSVAGDEEFAKKQAEKIDDFCTTALRALPPDEFMDLLYSAIEQDAWLLYAHGGFLGIFVGCFHLLLFGA